MSPSICPRWASRSPRARSLEWRKQAGDEVDGRRDARRRHHRQGGRRDPLPAPGVVSRSCWSSPVRPWPSAPRSPRSTRALAPRPQTARRESRGRRGPPPSRRPRRPRETCGDRSRFYSPVVRRIAEEHGVDLEQVEGTGIGGRVRKRDLVAFIETGAQRTERRERPLHTESPYRPDEPRAGARTNGPVELVGDRREPMSPMRQAIARHMVESRRTAAHCTTIVEVDMQPGGGPSRRAQGGDEAARRAPHLPRVRRPGDRGGAGQSSRC